MKKEIPLYMRSPFYPLSPAQQTVYEMSKTSMYKQQMQLPTAFEVDGELDFRVLAGAINTVIARNDCMRIRFRKEAGEIKQCILREYKLDGIRRFNFKSLGEKRMFLENDASSSLKIFSDETYRIYFYSCTGKSGVYLNVSRMTMDYGGAVLFYKELFSVYNALKNTLPEPEKPLKFEAQLEYESLYLKSPFFASDAEAISANHREGGMPYYCGLHGSGLLLGHRIRKNDPSLTVPFIFTSMHDKTKMLCTVADRELSERMNDYCRRTGTGIDSLIKSGYILYASYLNGRVNNVTLNVELDRRFSDDDKKTGGVFSQLFIEQMCFDGEDSFAELLKKISEKHVFNASRGDFPYISSRRIRGDLYGFTEMQEPSFMTLSVRNDSEDTEKIGYPGELQRYCTGRSSTPLQVFVYTDKKDKTTVFEYIFEDGLFDEARLCTVHAYVLRLIRLGIADDTVKVNSLYDSL